MTELVMLILLGYLIHRSYVLASPLRLNIHWPRTIKRARASKSGWRTGSLLCITYIKSVTVVGDVRDIEIDGPFRNEFLSRRWTTTRKSSTITRNVVAQMPSGSMLSTLRVSFGRGRLTRNERLWLMDVILTFTLVRTRVDYFPRSPYRTAVFVCAFDKFVGVLLGSYERFRFCEPQTDIKNVFYSPRTK